MYMAIMILIQNRNFWTDFYRARRVARSPELTAVREPFNLSKTAYPSNVGFDPKFLVTRQIRVIIIMRTVLYPPTQLFEASSRPAFPSSHRKSTIISAYLGRPVYWLSSQLPSYQFRLYSISLDTGSGHGPGPLFIHQARLHNG